MLKGTTRSVPVVIILSLVTCGIYYWYWLYITAAEVKNYTNDPSINPGVELLLCIVTCGIYTIYWYYKYSKKVYEAQIAAGIPGATDNTVLNTVLALFFPPVSMGILQSSLNELWGHGEAN